MSKPAIWPSFFIVGAAKAGTTSLYSWLKQHPQVYMSPVKEPHFFSSDLVVSPRFIVRDEAEYLRLFKKANGYKAIGEASASYLAFAGVVAARIKGAIPDARIIVLLRDPAERAYSDYLMYVRQGLESRSFIDALRRSPFAAVYAQTYATPLGRYLEVFGEEHTLVLMFEQLKHSPRELLVEVARFLRVDVAPMWNVDISVENPGGMPRGKWATRSLVMRRRLRMRRLPLPKGVRALGRRALLGRKPSIDPRALDYLRPVLEKDVNELERLLGRPLPELRKVW